jgi:Ran GTPase-activating protein (RanGAP) involved in mRNA processing and transport
MNNDEPIVWHDTILDEYWNRIEEKIDGRKQQEIVTEIEGIEIKNIEMKKDRLAALVAIFSSGRANSSSTTFRFINTNLCGEGIIWLSKLVDACSQLQVFYLTHNRIDCMESARCLSRALKSQTRIGQLHLAHCVLGSSPEILSVLLQSDVSLIDLNNNNIDSLGAAKIAEYFEGDPPVHRIDLDYNLLNDDDATLISQALKRNTKLKLLSLHSNNFTSIGVKALLTCVFDSSSLNSISESNHTLTGMIIFSGQESQKSDNLVGCIDILLELNRTQKIMLALQDKDSLLQYLINIPVELIPKVLAFPFQQDIDQHQHRHLSIVYSIMRWWNMPMLYSYHNCIKSDAKRKRDD